MTEYISCDSKCKFNSATCNLKQNVKIITSAKKVWILSHVFVRIVSI